MHILTMVYHIATYSCCMQNPITKIVKVYWSHTRHLKTVTSKIFIVIRTTGFHEDEYTCTIVQKINGARAKMLKQHHS